MIDRDKSVSWLRERRLTFGFLDSSFGFQTTVFLGLFEGRRYLKARLRELQNQTNQAFYLLIADNSSDDFDPSLIETEIKAVGMDRGRWLVVRNPVNLGGLGSFQLNLDLVPSEWVTSMHQDDSYSSNHLSVHIETMQDLNADVLSISSDMGSLDSDGTRIAPLPRANWFIRDPSRADLFLASIGMQIIPFPAMSIRKSIVELDIVPWTTVAFSDSELSLRILMTGAHEFIQKETVLYRENPNSESHVQGIEVRNHSAALGLLRVFGSADFKSFVGELAPERREAFARKLQQGIYARVQDRQAADLVVAFTLEQLAHTWGYTVASTNEHISKVFLRKRQNYSAELLQGLNHLMSEHQPMKTSKPGSARPEDMRNEIQILDETGFEPRKKLSLPAVMRRVALATLGSLPYPLRRRAYKVIVFVYSKLRPGNKWDFNW